jgi:hypothetical protein|tara:strand:- start:489 stop:803 length:315 start_codon:yes stop_codon:yes gene_type:complete
MTSIAETIKNTYLMYLRQSLEFILGASYIYIMWITAHYIAAHMYASICVPATIIGFITAPFLVPAPHCQALRWTIYTGGEKIFAMWVLLGTWMFNKVNLKDKNI